MKKNIKEIYGVLMIEHEKTSKCVLEDNKYYVDVKEYCREHKCPAIESVYLKETKCVQTSDGTWDWAKLEHPVLELELHSTTLTPKGYTAFCEAFEAAITVRTDERYDEECGPMGTVCLIIEIIL